MFITRKHLSRRTVLKGAGVTLALPFLEAMVPAATPLAQTAAAPQLRAGFFYLPHGAIQFETKLGPEADRWTPSGSGDSFRLNTITQPLEPFKKYVSVIGNLDNPAGAGRHTRNPGTWLNCGSGTTIDQMIAKKIGQGTAIPCLEVASETTVQQAAGNGTATAITVSFNENTPLKMEYNPRNVFIQLFGEDVTPANRISRIQETNSLLDLIMDGTKALQSELGPGDKAVLENYLDSVRKVERESEAMKNDLSRIKAPEAPPPGPLDDFSKQVELMFHLIALALQADITRVASFFMVAEGSNQTYNHIGVPDSFHPVSHHANEPDKMARVARIQTWHMQMFADFLAKMASTRDGDGSLLDHSIFLYGSNMGNSDKHSNWPIPTVVAGGGAGRMKRGGQFVSPAERTRLANVHLTLLNKFGIEQDSFADSTGMISEL
ncbi:MAG TPA: DUF1552 domain-containing protein [Terriglobia bacterium]|nr:DUF1552 domain-containing protein [Terriglobia bacterium]